MPAFAWRTNWVDPWPLDSLLRSHGWQLAHNGRPTGDESIWQRGEVMCCQSLALDILLQSYGFIPVGKRWRRNGKKMYRDEALRSLIAYHSNPEVQKLMRQGLD